MPYLGLVDEGWWEPQTPRGAEQNSQTREPATSGEQKEPQEEALTGSKIGYNQELQNI